MKQLYEIGEKVALQSETLPEHNGEYYIEAIIEANEDFECRLTGQIIYTNEGHAYILDTPLVDLIECDGVEALWLESSLRKIHEAGDMSYEELMNSLKSPVLEWQ